MSKLEVTDLNIRADGKEVVSGVSFTVSPGELHVLMGANGSGKSTLAGTLMGHPKFEVTHGDIQIDGDSIVSMSPDKRAHLGLFLSMQYLPEVEGVTLSNFLYRAYKNLHPDEAVSVIDFRKKLEDTAERLKVSKTFFDRDLHVGFSGGEKKLSELLQLAALSPKFAILDELDSGVDVDGLGKITKLLKQIGKEGVGILLISHNPTILGQLSPDMVYVIREGKLVRSGSKELIDEITQNGFENIQ